MWMVLRILKIASFPNSVCRLTYNFPKNRKISFFFLKIGFAEIAKVLNFKKKSFLKKDFKDLYA
jgi:hypothetical protein